VACAGVLQISLCTCLRNGATGLELVGATEGGFVACVGVLHLRALALVGLALKARQTQLELRELCLHACDHVVGFAHCPVARARPVAAVAAPTAARAPTDAGCCSREHPNNRCASTGQLRRRDARLARAVVGRGSSSSSIPFASRFFDPYAIR
jgi:hypothetical protein